MTAALSTCSACLPLTAGVHQPDRHPAARRAGGVPGGGSLRGAGLPARVAADAGGAAGQVPGCGHPQSRHLPPQDSGQDTQD